MLNKRNEHDEHDITFMLRAMQQQFERMNVLFEGIRDRLDQQDDEIDNLR